MIITMACCGSGGCGGGGCGGGGCGGGGCCGGGCSGGSSGGCGGAGCGGGGRSDPPHVCIQFRDILNNTCSNETTREDTNDLGKRLENTIRNNVRKRFNKPITSSIPLNRNVVSHPSSYCCNDINYILSDNIEEKNKDEMDISCYVIFIIIMVIIFICINIASSMELQYKVLFGILINCGGIFLIFCCYENKKNIVNGYMKLRNDWDNYVDKIIKDEMNNIKEGKDNIEITYTNVVTKNSKEYCIDLNYALSNIKNADVYLNENSKDVSQLITVITSIITFAIIIFNINKEYNIEIIIPVMIAYTIIISIVWLRYKKYGKDYDRQSINEFKKHIKDLKKKIKKSINIRINSIIDKEKIE
jgi:hypothetical protein